MIITIDKDAIVHKFLNPISRLTEECSIHLTDNEIYALVNDLAGNIILHIKLQTQTSLTDEFVLNVKDIRKLSRVFDCVDTAIIDLTVDPNASVLKYASPKLSFKLHLNNENVMRKCQISLDKMNSLKFDSEFKLTGDKLSEILKGSIFATETNKIYFFSKDGNIHAELTDKTTQDIDSITFIVTDTIKGEDLTSPLPFSVEVLRLLSGLRPDSIQVMINNTYKLIKFKITTDVSETSYLIPAYVK